MNKMIIKLLIHIVIFFAIGGIIAGIFDQKEQKNSQHKPFGVYEKYFKRPLDFFISSIALIVLSPLMIVTAFFVYIRLGKPIIFKQKRPGKEEKIFTLFKFRSMSDKRDKNGKLLSDEERLTDFGLALRSSSIDELPELCNILLGQMSIVGPRPLLEEYLSQYNDIQKHRHDVRPGLTGLAQVNGRNKLSWETKFEEDIEYVNNITFINDCKIIIRTIKQVFKKDGISSSTSVTIEKFKGKY